MTNPQPRGSILGPQIEKRLAQLGLSRREFARRANIGRQTLQEIIHDPLHRISDKTFAALDKGLKWEAGASKAFHEGNPNARIVVGMSTDERINGYLLQILVRLAQMDIDQLEREVLLLEEESGDIPRESETSRLIEQQIRHLVKSLLGTNPHGGISNTDGESSESAQTNPKKGETVTAGFSYGE